MSGVTVEGTLIARRVHWATSPRARMRGLVNHPLERGEALVLVPARQVHTFGMTFPIDVVFCDRNGTVLHVVRAMKPWRITRWVPRAHYVIELPGGSLAVQASRGSRVSLPRPS